MGIELNRCQSSLNRVELRAGDYLFLTAISVIIGLFSFLAPAILFSLLMILCGGMLIYLTAGEESKRFVIVFFIIGIVLRLVLSVFLDVLVNFYPSIITIWGDSVLVTLRARDAAYFLATESADNLMAGKQFLFAPRGTYGYTDYIYFQATIFYFFGYSPLSITFLNTLLGASSAVLIFYVAKKLFDVTIAKATLIFCMFFPTLFFWSATNMREAIFIFLTAVYILAFVRLIDRFKLGYALILALALFLQGGIRREIIYVTSFSILVAYFAVCRVGFVKKVFVVILISLFIILTPAGRRAIQLNPKRYFSIVFNYHIGHITTRGTTYKILDEKYYRSPDSLNQMSYVELGAVLARAWFHFLAEPFPIRFETKLQAFAGFPLSMIWYSLLPFAIIGFFQGLFRYKSRGIWAIAIYFLIFASIIAITGGNVGTLIRLRDMVTPFILTFAASALVNTLRQPNARAGYLQPSASIS